MRSRLLTEGDARTYVLVFETGDEAVQELSRFAEEEDVTAASLTAIGGFATATLAYFDPEERRYIEIPVESQSEVLSLVGDVASKDGKPFVHAHVVLGLRDGATRGGHLQRAVVRPTLEIMLTETPAHLARVHDEETGLALISPDDPGHIQA